MTKEKNQYPVQRTVFLISSEDGTVQKWVSRVPYGVQCLARGAEIDGKLRLVEINRTLLWHTRYTLLLDYLPKALVILSNSGVFDQTHFDPNFVLAMLDNTIGNGKWEDIIKNLPKVKDHWLYKEPDQDQPHSNRSKARGRWGSPEQHHVSGRSGGRGFASLDPASKREPLPPEVIKAAQNLFLYLIIKVRGGFLAEKSTLKEILSIIEEYRQHQRLNHYELVASVYAVLSFIGQPNLGEMDTAYRPTDEPVQVVKAVLETLIGSWK